MNLEREIRIANGIEQIIDSRGVIRYKDTVTGKFVRPTGEYISHIFTVNNNGMKKVSMNLGKIQPNKVIADSIKMIDKPIQVNGKNIKAIILVTVGITTLATGGAIMYRNHRTKKRAQELQKIGFEFIEEGGEELGNL